MEFLPIKKGISDKISVWNYFLIEKSGNLAKCNKCGKK